MDLDLIALLMAAGLGDLVPWVLSAGGAAAWLVAAVPVPKAAWLVPVWKVLNVLGGNVRHAKNAASLAGAILKPPDRKSP